MTTTPDAKNPAEQSESLEKKASALPAKFLKRLDAIEESYSRYRANVVSTYAATFSAAMFTDLMYKQEPTSPLTYVFGACALISYGGVVAGVLRHDSLDTKMKSALERARK